MNKQQLFENIKRKKSFLCVGLDTDIKKIPEHLLKEEDPIFAFNKAIIDATADLCIAYKPNLAFYESMGVKGWIAFENIPFFHKTGAGRKRLGNHPDTGLMKPIHNIGYGRTILFQRDDRPCLLGIVGHIIDPQRQNHSAEF